MNPGHFSPGVSKFMEIYIIVKLFNINTHMFFSLIYKQKVLG